MNDIERKMWEAAQRYQIVLNLLTLRQFKQLEKLTSRIDECGAWGDPHFFKPLERVRNPLQLEHALEQWEALCRDRATANAKPTPSHP